MPFDQSCQCLQLVQALAQDFDILKLCERWIDQIMRYEGEEADGCPRTGVNFHL